jgi:hypothetical protein
MLWQSLQRITFCLPATLQTSVHNQFNFIDGKDTGSKFPSPARVFDLADTRYSGGGREKRLEEDAKAGVSQLKEKGQEALDKTKDIAEQAKAKLTK